MADRENSSRGFINYPLDYSKKAYWRATIVAKAQKKLRAEFGELDQSQFLIIGDTPKDVKCAHDNDFGALAVATGIYRLKIFAI